MSDVRPEGRSLRAALEEALADDPDDLAAHMAYADFLQEQTDPHLTARGEFIQVQLALADPKTAPEQHKRLRQREVELLRKHFAAWCGYSSPFMLERVKRDDVVGDVLCAVDNDARYHFTRGWVERLEVQKLHGAFARALRDNPLLRLVRHLEIDATNYWDPGYDDLAAAAFLTNVRTFRLGRAPDSSVAAHGDQVARLVAHMPNVEEIRLYAHVMPTHPLFCLRLPQLRVLEADNLVDYDLHALAANASLGRLRRLKLTPSLPGPDDDPDDEFNSLPLFQVIALVYSEHLTSLESLTLNQSDMGDAGCEHIVRSGILKRLKELNLARGRITDAGARTLGKCPDFRHLGSLAISFNALTPSGIDTLRETGVLIEAGSQYSSADTAGAHLRLYEDDME
jgi:uncharacterized protein (TIGR02996 family)